MADANDPGRASTSSASRTPTIYDVAALAGVNPSTVSRALRQSGRVSPRTIQRVLDAAAELNFSANPMARALPTGRMQTIAVTILAIGNPMFLDVLRAAEQAAAERGYTVVLAFSESAEREPQAIERVLPASDGLLVLTTRMDDARLAEIASRKSTVLVNRRVDGIECIVPDQRVGMTEAVEHLAALGHRSVAFLSNRRPSWMGVTRWELYVELVRSRGMHIVEIGPFEPTDGDDQAVLQRVLDSGVTAVLAFNDLLALRLLKAARAAGVDVPGRFSVIGFDDVFGADFSGPALTTVRVPLTDLGRIGVLRLIDAIEGSDGDASAVEPTATRLVVRESTGPAPQV